MLAAGLLPFAPGLALDRSNAPKDESATDSQATVTSHIQRKSDVANSPARVPGIAAPDAFELKVSSSGGRWSLPSQDAKSGWLIAVGTSSQDQARHHVRIHARATAGSLAQGDRVEIRPVGRNPQRPDDLKHVVARHRNLTSPAHPAKCGRSLLP